MAINGYSLDSHKLNKFTQIRIHNPPKNRNVNIWGGRGHGHWWGKGDHFNLEINVTILILMLFSSANHWLIMKVQMKNNSAANLGASWKVQNRAILGYSLLSTVNSFGKFCHNKKILPHLFFTKQIYYFDLCFFRVSYLNVMWKSMRQQNKKIP